MRVDEAFRLGVAGLRSHKLRSFLTTLGIVFGVAAVISMLSIGEGAKQEALEQFELLGIDNVLVDDRPVEDTESGEGRTNLSRGLVLADARAIAASNPLVSRVVPIRRLERKLQYGPERVSATIVGTTPEFADAMNVTAAAGRFFNENDVLELSRVCALGAGIKRDLFFYKDAIGERLKIGRDWYTVIGVMQSRGVSTDDASGYLRDTNRDVYIPLSCALKRFSRDQFASELDRLVVQVNDQARIREAANLVQSTMERRHGGADDYRILIPEELMRRKQATQRIFNIVMGAIASISLLVGGIGIMNIMLASILERTREIGVRRAMGARQNDVMLQFLLEAVSVSFLGGLMGVALGFGLTRAIATYAGWLTIISPGSVALAFGVSAAVGIVFGYYPARRAARMDPIECLRYE